MARKEIKNLQVDDIGKGINLFTRDTMISNNELIDGYNIWAVGKNSVAKRPGIVKLCTIAGVSKIDGIGVYINGATRELLAMAGGKLYRIQSGTAVQITSGSSTWTTGKRTDFVQAAGKLFIANGVEKIRSYDGSTITEDATNSVVASWMIYYKSCLWAGGNPTYPTRLYRSGTDTKIGNYTYDASTNPLATSVYVSKDDGTDLKGMFKHQDYLYPVKENSLWRASVGSDQYQLITLEMVDPARGCDAHATIDTVDNDNFMFNEAGVFATGYEPNVVDQIRTNIVSLRVDNKIKQIQKSRLEEVVGMYFDNHFYLSFTSGGSGYNDSILVYDRQRLGWWEWQLSDVSGNPTGANCFSTFKDADGYTKLYLGSSTDGSVYYFDEIVKQDAGYSIVTTLRSKKFGFDQYSQMKFFLDALIYVGKTPGEITVTVYVDNELATTREVTIGNTGYAGMGLMAIGEETIGTGGGTLTITDNGGGNFIRLPINKLGRNIQVKVEDNNGDKSWELNAIIFNYKEINSLYQPKTL